MKRSRGEGLESEDRANIVGIRLIVVVRVAVVEVHVPSVVGIVLNTRPIVVGLFLSSVLCLLAPAPSGIGRKGDALRRQSMTLIKMIQLTPPSRGQTDSRKRYLELFSFLSIRSLHFLSDVLF